MAVVQSKGYWPGAPSSVGPARSPITFACRRYPPRRCPVLVRRLRSRRRRPVRPRRRRWRIATPSRAPPTRTWHADRAVGGDLPDLRARDVVARSNGGTKAAVWAARVGGRSRGATGPALVPATPTPHRRCVLRRLRSHCFRRAPNSLRRLRRCCYRFPRCRPIRTRSWCSMPTNFPSRRRRRSGRRGPRRRSRCRRHACPGRSTRSGRALAWTVGPIVSAVRQRCRESRGREPTEVVFAHKIPLAGCSYFRHGASDAPGDQFQRPRPMFRRADEIGRTRRFRSSA